MLHNRKVHCPEKKKVIMTNGIYYGKLSLYKPLCLNKSQPSTNTTLKDFRLFPANLGFFKNCNGSMNVLENFLFEHR